LDGQLSHRELPDNDATTSGGSAYIGDGRSEQFSRVIAPERVGSTSLDRILQVVADVLGQTSTQSAVTPRAENFQIAVANE